MTTGFSKMAQREYAVFDLREFSQPVVKNRLDDYAGLAFPFFDEDTKVLYIAGKGETAISLYQYSVESPNLIDFLGAYKGKEPQRGFSFMPKRVVDLMSCEMMRGVRLTGSAVEYVSFKVPRKSGLFQADLFPPCRGPEPSMKFEDYFAGTDKEPVRIELKPEMSHDVVSTKKKQTFLAKIGHKDAASI